MSILFFLPCRASLVLHHGWIHPGKIRHVLPLSVRKFQAEDRVKAKGVVDPNSAPCQPGELVDKP